MNHPKVSVVMPVYNEEKFLDKSIQSILNQTFKDFEFIIVNDCSKDNSRKIIEKYKKIDKRIILINNKKNKNFPEVRNIGIRASKGKYIANMDGDDISHPKRIEKQFNYLEKNHYIFLVGSSAIYINEEGVEINRFRKYDNYKLLAWRLPKSCSIIDPSTMFRNEGFLYGSGFGGAVDYNFYLDLLEKGKNLTNLPEFLVKYRLHANSMSISKRKEQETFRDKTQELHKHLNNKVNLFNKIIYSIRLFFHYLRTMNEKNVLKGIINKIYR